MSHPNTETAHRLTKTILQEWHNYHGVSRAVYDRGYTKSYRSIRQILDWGADPDKRKPVLVNMREVESNLLKRDEAIGKLWCECANSIGYQGERNWRPWD